jgi:phage gp45-like
MYARIRHMVGIGRTTAPPNDAGNIQTVQVQFDNLRTKDNTPVAFHFGFSACLPNGTDVITVALGGDGSGHVIVASNNQSLRPLNLQPGESMVYDAFGNSIYLKGESDIIATALAQMLVTSPSLTTTGNVVAGNGASGSFTTPTGQVVTVQNGIITNIY